MPRIVSSDVNLNISITATSPFSQRKALRVEDKSSSEEVLDQEAKESSRREVNVSTDNKVEDRLKLPILTKATKVKSEEKNELQVLLRGIQCFDFTIRELTSDWNDKSNKKLPSCSSRRREVASNMQERIPIVSDENAEHNSEMEESANESLKDNPLDSKLPLSRSILEGQRVNLRQKVGLNKQRKQFNHCEVTEKGNKLSKQHDFTSEDPHIENILMKSINTRKASSDMVSIKTGKQNHRPVFHLPKADKYDITPRSIINSKVCSVLRVNDVKSSSFFYSGYNNTWIPRRDGYVIKNSVFKTIAQQPAVFLREPSPVAGIKMTLKEHEDSLVEAIQAVEKTNTQISSVDAEVTRQVKKFIIRLPPIC